jgi:hypothetical protein
MSELPGPKTTSVDAQGEPDGFQPPLAYYGEVDPSGMTRLVISSPHEETQALHACLIKVLKPPLGVLYRQMVCRQEPGPEGSPPKDFVALELTSEQVLAALEQAKHLIYHDARCEVWVRGALEEQLVLDEDGVLYAYPDDPAFRDALEERGLPDQQVRTLADVDYPKRWFHGENDALEAQLMEALGLMEVAHR